MAVSATGTKYVYALAEGSREMRDLLGGKGANLAEMARVLGEDRVPAGFTVSTEACVAYLRAGIEPEGLDEQLRAALGRLESTSGRRLGDPEDPLLVSVRSGARISMPGMMDTVLNLGLNRESVAGMIRRTGNPRFVWDCYRRFVQMYGEVVRGTRASSFEAEIAQRKLSLGVDSDSELGATVLEELATKFEDIVAKASGDPLPAEPWEQLRESVRAVFDSWNNPRARTYRRLEGIPDDWGTAVTVQQMVFGNTGDSSGSGVAFSRDALSGEAVPSGDFLSNAQGEDVVAGVRNTEDLDELAVRLPEVYVRLLDDLARLERHFRDMQDVEFTVEDGRLFLLQTRSAKRSAQAALRFACDAVEEGLLGREEALESIDAERLESLLHASFAPDAEFSVAARGVPASPGAAKGGIAFSAADAIAAAGRGEDVILVRPFTVADDVAGFHAARGILTSEGGRASHAALVARGMGRPCVAGASDVRIDPDAELLVVDGSTLRPGDKIAIEGSQGIVTLDDVALAEPAASEELETVLGWADAVRRVGIRANADTPEDVERAVRLGAEGIGLCRTEHMFFGEDRDHLVQDTFLAAERWRRRNPEGGGASSRADVEFEHALAELKAIQRGDFEAILQTISGRPMTVRLLDPPMHEFLGGDRFLRELAAARDEGVEDAVREAQARVELVEELRETNPMLGTRGSRLGLLYPPLYEMQVAALIEAAIAVQRDGVKTRVEIMLPLISYEGELVELRALVDRVAEQTMETESARVQYSVGTMIEVPRACFAADRIARSADFFSFGTNDLTQTAIGLSRDDVEGRILPRYLEGLIVDRSPFETLDETVVAALLDIAVSRGREGNGSLKLGVCGEHGGDPASIAMLKHLELDYVSCSPDRLPVARLAAAQTAIKGSDIR